MIDLDVEHPIWDRFFWVSPLVVIGTKEPDGSYDLAPKHMVTPLGWENYFGFVCAPTHATSRNALREGAFTVSYPRPDQLVFTSLAAEPRTEAGAKSSLSGFPTVPAEVVDGVLLEGSHLYLECELDRIVEGFGANSLIAGKIVAARVLEQAARAEERDDQELIARAPLFAYLPPGRFASVEESRAFPFPAGFER